MKILLLMLFITAGSMHSYSLESRHAVVRYCYAVKETDTLILWDDISAPLRSDD